MATSFADAERRLAALPREEQGPRRELLERAAEFAVDQPLAEITSLVDRMAERDLAIDQRGETQDTWSLNEARKRNLERLLEDQARLVRESIEARTLRSGMNVSRQRLHQLVVQGRLVSIQLQEGSGSLFPFWQFQSGTPVRPIDHLAQLIHAAREADMDMVMLHFFMVEPNDRLGGRAPHELLAEGGIDRVIALLQSSGLGS